MRNTNQYADERYVWSIFSQLVGALYRCHYGMDPPAVGNLMGKSGELRPLGLKGKNAVMILHRDLKPENGELDLRCAFASRADRRSVPGR